MKLLAIILALGTSTASADNGVPWKISYQGVLSQNGQPINGAQTMEFDLFTTLTGGTAIWSSSPMNVNLSQGAFSVTLGTTENPISTGTVAGGQLYLQVKVGGTILSPREEITSAVYALRAGSLSGLNIDSSGNVGLGVAPQAKLDVGAGAIQQGAMSDPGQPPANSALIWVRTTTSGCAVGRSKSQLVVRFNPDSVFTVLHESPCQ